MTQITLRHISTNKYNHTITAYETPKPMTGYIVTVQADGKKSEYDFLDSYELALEYRDALMTAYDDWSKEAARAENLHEATGNESGFASADLMWAGYLRLAHDAIYPRWELVSTDTTDVLQPNARDHRRNAQLVADSVELDDMEATQDAACGRWGW